MLLSHQISPIIPLVLTVPHLLKVRTAAGCAGWLAAVLVDWKNFHKKSHQIRLPILSSRSQKAEISLQFKQETHYLHLHSILSIFLHEALGRKNE